MERILIICLLWAILHTQKVTVSATECMKRKYEITFNMYGQVTINRTLKCDMYFQWTVSDYCCIDKYDVFEKNAYCCYSETYKLVLAVGFICLVLLGCSLSIFLCWIYNLPHYIMYLITCGKFSLNDWTIKNKNSPYVDPSFYSGEPFWARGAEMQHYPLRPMPPKVFYPAPPPKLKYRWDMAHGELPLFIVASRQFTRNPYSARPQDRQTTQPNYNHNPNHDSNNNSQSRKNSLNNESDSQRKSLASAQVKNNNLRRGATASSIRKTSSDNGATSGSATSRKSSFDNVHYNPPQYGPSIDEADAAQELMEALKFFDDEDRNKPLEDSTTTSQGTNLGRISEQISNSQRRRQEVFIISGGGAHGSGSMANCQATGRNGRIQLDQIRPNTTGSLGTFDQYGNYVSLSHLGMTESQRLKINSRGNPNNPNNMGVSVYSLPGVHTAGVLSTVQNYHVVSSNLGNPMETILEDDSLEDQDLPFMDNDDKSSSSTSASTSSNSSTPKRNNHGSIRVENERESRKPFPPPRRRRASSMALGSTSSNSLNHVLGPTPTARAFVPFQPTLPGFISDHPTYCDNTEADDNSTDKPRRNSII